MFLMESNAFWGKAPLSRYEFVSSESIFVISAPLLGFYFPVMKVFYFSQNKISLQDKDKVNAFTRHGLFIGAACECSSALKCAMYI